MYTVPEAWEPTKFDTEILGLKYALIAALSDAGFGWFRDFTDVDACLTESILSLRILCEPTSMVPTLKTFCRTYKFTIAYWDRQTGRIALVRQGVALPKGPGMEGT